jgi:RNA polymerase sigma factor (sigma-70 family)
VERYCLRRLRSPEEAQDATQVVFITAYRCLADGIEPLSESAWLFKIAENVVLGRRRTLARRARVEYPIDVDRIAEAAAATERDSAFELDGLREALASMPYSQRQAIVLREWYGLSYREVAEVLGISRSAVEALIFRARRGLSRRLETRNRIARNGQRFLLLPPGGSLRWLFGGGTGAKAITAATSLAVIAVGARPTIGHLIDVVDHVPVTKVAPESTGEAVSPELVSFRLPARAHSFTVDSPRVLDPFGGARPSEPAGPVSPAESEPTSDSPVEAPAALPTQPSDGGQDPAPPAGDVDGRDPPRPPQPAPPLEPPSAAGPGQDAGGGDGGSPGDQGQGGDGQGQDGQGQGAQGQGSQGQGQGQGGDRSPASIDGPPGQDDSPGQGQGNAWGQANAGGQGNAWGQANPGGQGNGNGPGNGNGGQGNGGGAQGEGQAQGQGQAEGQGQGQAQGQGNGGQSAGGSPPATAPGQVQAPPVASAPAGAGGSPTSPAPPADPGQEGDDSVGTPPNASPAVPGPPGVPPGQATQDAPAAPTPAGDQSGPRGRQGGESAS